MFDNLYSKLTSKIPYKILIIIPPIITLLSIFIILTNGVSFGIDFQGGTWVDVTLNDSFDQGTLDKFNNDLSSLGLSDVKSYTGFDIDTKTNKLTVVTTDVVNESFIRPVFSKYIGNLSQIDIAKVQLNIQPTSDLRDKLLSRFPYMDIRINNRTIILQALDINEEELKSAIEYYTGEKPDIEIQKKNLNIRSVGPTLGKTFREQGVKALMWAFILMSLVVFIAFKDFVPSIAVVQSAICDPLIALGGMSLFKVPFDSSSLGALLMLIGYSVDTDILLTARVLKQKGSEIDENINGAMKTGLMMTLTTLTAMIITLLVTAFVIQIPTLNTIATVLIFGLIMDLFTTWFTNTGLLKWHLSRPRTATKKRIFKFSIFSK